MKINFFPTLLIISASLAVLSEPAIYSQIDTVKSAVFFTRARQFAKDSNADSAIFYYSAAGDGYLQSGDTAGKLKCDYRILNQLQHKKADSTALILLLNDGTSYQPWFKGHPVQEAEYYYKLGEKFTDNLKFEEAVQSYQRSLPLWNKYARDSVKQIKNVFKAISYVYSGIGQYDSAILYLHKSLDVYAAKYGLLNRVAVNTYLGLGIAYFYRGEIDKGIDYYRKALTTNLVIPDFFESDLAWTYNNLGISYYVKKDYYLSMIYIRKAMALFIKNYGEQSEEVAWCYNNIGISYQELKDDRQAYFYQDKALKIRLAILGENHPDVASSYNNLGVICEDKKDYANELLFFKKALRIRKNLFSESNQDVAETYSNLGATYMLMNQYDSAYSYYEKALYIFQNHYKSNTGFISGIYVHMSQIDLAMGNLTLAFENVQKSMETLLPGYKSNNIDEPLHLTGINNYADLIRALENKASILQWFYNNKSGDPDDLDKCLKVFQLISDINDRFSHQLREENAKLFAEGNAKDLFGEAVNISYRLSKLKKDDTYLKRAFYFAEKARAFVLSEAIDETNALHFAGIPDSMLTLEKNVRIEKTNCELKLKELQQSNTDSAKLKNVEDKYFAWTMQYQQIIDSLELKFPTYQCIRNAPDTISTSAIMAGLDNKTAIFEYLITGDSLFIFAFTHSNFRVALVKLDSSAKQTIINYPRNIRKLITANFTANSNLLYQILIAPVKDMAKDCERLIIIPDGQLFYIPFETLVAKGNNAQPDFSRLDYLIRKYDISYHYSVGLWLRNKVRLAAKNTPINGFIGFAPVFKKKCNEGNVIAAQLLPNDSINGETAMRSAVSGGQKFAELGYTEKEISSIVSLFGKNQLQAKGYLFSEATEANFKKEACKYKYVHIASHGFCDDKEPNLSGIAFYQIKQDSIGLQNMPDENKENNEGILFSGETYNLSLNADLVVLSACESGTGRLMKGEGIMGLTRGFLFAGTPNILYSIWKVGDLTTSKLMTDFYKYVLQKNNYAHALRLAKLNLLNRETSSFPKFWSSFELVGE